MSDSTRLKKVLEAGQELNLGNLFDYLQGIAEGLSSIVRWEAREKIAGQSVRENDLEHTFKMIFLTIVYAIEENELRGTRDKLDIGMLAMIALAHDVGEIVENDTAHYEKVEKEPELYMREIVALQRIIAPLPTKAREYFQIAIQCALQKTQLPIYNKEGHFFNAMEQLDHLKRGLHECRLGNLHFAPKCLDWHIKGLRKHSKEFPSLKKLYEPYIKETKYYLEEFEKQKDKYLEEFIRRGGKKEDFPF